MKEWVLTKNSRFDLNAFVYYFIFDLTASFFETGAMAAPNKSQYPAILGQGVRLVPYDQKLAGFQDVTIGH